MNNKNLRVIFVDNCEDCPYMSWTIKTYPICNNGYLGQVKDGDDGIAVTGVRTDCPLDKLDATNINLSSQQAKREQEVVAATHKYMAEQYVKLCIEANKIMKSEFPQGKP